MTGNPMAKIENRRKTNNSLKTTEKTSDYAAGIPPKTEEEIIFSGVRAGFLLYS